MTDRVQAPDVGTLPGSVPVTGDWNGDGKDKGRRRSAADAWSLDVNGNGVWDGMPTDIVTTISVFRGDTGLSGDWNGDGKTRWWGLL